MIDGESGWRSIPDPVVVPGATTPGGCVTARAAAACRRRRLQPTEILAGALYYMGIFQFDDELVHCPARRPHWQTDSVRGEVLTPLANGGGSAPIIDVDHDLTFRAGRRLISDGSRFTVHRADRSDQPGSRWTPSPTSPGLGGYQEFKGYASGYWRGTDFIGGFTVNGDDAGGRGTR